MDLKPGTRLRSATSSAELIVVRAPSEAVIVECAGSPLTAVATGFPPAESIAERAGEPVQLGKRYVDHPSNLELLCTKAGVGPLLCERRPMPLKESKPLPSSD